MSISLTGVVIRHERRIRLVFSNTLAIGAFNPTLYKITATDPSGSSPIVTQALIVPSVGTNVELSLDRDLVIGCHYRVEADGIPAIDSSVTPTPSIEPFTFAASLVKSNVEPKTNDLDLLLFDRDIVFNNGDFQEAANGDLADISGAPNAKAAIRRRLVSDGLPWDATYGAKPRQFVDGASAAIGTLKASLEKQALQDDRVKSVNAALKFDPNDPTVAFFDTTINLAGISFTVKSTI